MAAFLVRNKSLNKQVKGKQTLCVIEGCGNHNYRFRLCFKHYFISVLAYKRVCVLICQSCFFNLARFNMNVCDGCSMKKFNIQITRVYQHVSNVEDAKAKIDSFVDLNVNDNYLVYFGCTTEMIRRLLEHIGKYEFEIKFFVACVIFRAKGAKSAAILERQLINYCASNKKIKYFLNKEEGGRLADSDLLHYGYIYAARITQKHTSLLENGLQEFLPELQQITKSNLFLRATSAFEITQTNNICSYTEVMRLLGYKIRKSTKLENEIRYSCSECDSQFATFQGLRKHVFRHFDRQCPQCPEKHKGRSFDNHIKSHKDHDRDAFWITCKICKLKMLSYNKHVHDLKLCLDGKRCKFCLKYFENSDLLAAHQEIKHSEGVVENHCSSEIEYSSLNDVKETVLKRKREEKESAGKKKLKQFDISDALSKIVFSVEANININSSEKPKLINKIEATIKTTELSEDINITELEKYFKILENKKLPMKDLFDCIRSICLTISK